MVHIRTILTLSIAILAVNNLLVEAGRASQDRIDRLQIRAKAHKEVLKPHEDGLAKHFGPMKEPVSKQLSEISDVIIDHIVKHKTFRTYLKNVFTILGNYAVGQIESRFDKLKKVYEKWENQNFPDKEKKDDALKLLRKQEKSNKALKKKNSKKSKAKVIDKKSTNKNDGQKKHK